jgi:hydroxymethylpyrimidine pyrophosphatase-like HAD family hydrolase
VSASLLMNLGTMVRRLEHELHDGSLLDAYLLAAGAGQIADDYLHPELYPFDRAASHLRRQRAPVARLAAGAAAAMAGAAVALGSRRPATAIVVRWRCELAGLADALAESQVAGVGLRAGGRAELARRARVLIAELERLPAALCAAVVRLPASFQQFDQRPADVSRLARRFADRSAERHRPVLAVGVRTSGSYLAPLCAASLKANGYQNVRAFTVRPGRPLLAHERALVGSVARHRGQALVLDDPPVTGSSVAAAARALERAGLPERAIRLLLPVFGAAELPPALQRYEAVLLPSGEWSVNADLETAAVRRALSALLGTQASVLAVEPLPLPATEPARGHMRALFRVRTVDAAGEQVERDVLVEGVGLGYLGAHRLAAQTLVERYSPEVLGLRDGLLYREWLPDARRLGSVVPAEEEPIAAEVVEYVAERRRALAVDEDLSLRIEQPAWEVASTILSRGFGRAWPLARVLLTDRATKRVLRVERASVVDGNTDLSQWFRGNGSIFPLAKPDVGEDRFSNLCAPCFDATFDLAGVTARADTRSLPRRLRRVYAAVTGEAVDEERWLLYELVHLWSRERTQPGEAANLQRARARALQRYFADVYFSDLMGIPDGPLCALDIDGVLEGEQLGFPALTPAAALALRSLMLHGYRPVLASGRSLPEVSERCRTYGLIGGVAEYGAATFESAGGRSEKLLPDTAAGALAQLRAALSGVEGVCLDPDYRFSVRAFTRERGRRRALSSRTTADALTSIGGADVQAITGEGQTDFVAVGAGKEPGLRALARGLSVDGERPFVLAVGDTASDVGFARLSARPCAPRHADPALRRAGFAIMTRPYQAGLAQAVGGLLGHPPGGCDVCRMPAPTPERAIVRALLGAQERGRAGIALRALELGWQIR